MGRALPAVFNRCPSHQNPNPLLTANVTYTNHNNAHCSSRARSALSTLMNPSCAASFLTSCPYSCDSSRRQTSRCPPTCLRSPPAWRRPQSARPPSTAQPARHPVTQSVTHQESPSIIISHELSSTSGGGVSSAQGGVSSAQWDVSSAQWGVSSAQDGVLSAQKVFYLIFDGLLRGVILLILPPEAIFVHTLHVHAVGPPLVQVDQEDEVCAPPTYSARCT
eukprot:6845238-Pyramimonas_sp.AAC.2